jgi:xanthine dehydrogenase accessory factor
VNTNLLQEIIGRCSQGEDLVLATIIKTSGSTPREAGTQMLVLSSGRILGTIGGGVGEEITRVKALAMLENRQYFQKLKLELDSDFQAQHGMVCGGKQELILELLKGQEGKNR